MPHRFITLIVCTLLSVCSAHAQGTADQFYLHRGDTVAAALHRIERPDHLWQQARWWNSANLLEALLDHQRLTGVRDATWCRQVYTANKLRFHGGYQNDYYDDSAWWALAWVKAFDLYNDKDYIRTAEQIFAYMQSTGYDTACGGGMAWHHSKRYKNAITNELYIVLAARLAERQTDSTIRMKYLHSALDCWQWLRNSGMMNEKHLFNDGLNEQCMNNKGITFTYNQGVILGGLTQLYRLTGDTMMLHTAREIAYSAITTLSDSTGILREPLHERNHDQVQFEGIFVRYLGELNATLHDPYITTWLRRNADSAWAHAQNSDHLFDCFWQGPYQEWSGSSTGCALDLMNAAAQ